MDYHPSFSFSFLEVLFFGFSGWVFFGGDFRKEEGLNATLGRFGV